MVQFVEPRIRFWKNESGWPQDAGGYVFAARALVLVGRRVLGSEWTDDAPIAEYVRELPTSLWLSTPSVEIERGVSILQDSDTAYLHRVGVGGLPSNFGESQFPTTAEWAEAVAIVNRIRAEAVAQLVPFLRASDLLSQACLQGTVKSATRGLDGGRFADQEWHLWNYDYAWCRLDLCRVDLEKPGRLIGPNEKSPWLFFEQASLDSYLLGPQSRADLAATQVPKERLSQRRPAGRRTQYDWPAMSRLFKDMVGEGKFDADTSTSSIAESLLNATADSWNPLPDKRAVEQKVCEWRALVFPDVD